jgi:hypothetical protein
VDQSIRLVSLDRLDGCRRGVGKGDRDRRDVIGAQVHLEHGAMGDRHQRAFGSRVA